MGTLLLIQGDDRDQCCRRGRPSTSERLAEDGPQGRPQAGPLDLVEKALTAVLEATSGKRDPQLFAICWRLLLTIVRQRDSDVLH